MLVMTTHRAPTPRPGETWEPVRAFSPSNLAHLIGTLLEVERQQRADVHSTAATKSAAADDRECRESL